MTELDEFVDDMAKEQYGTDVEAIDGDLGYDPETGALVKAEQKTEDVVAEEPAKEPEPEEKVEAEVKEPEPDSVFSDIVEDDDETGEPMVPLHVVKNLRKEKRELKAKLQEQTKPQPAGDKADVLSEILGDGDDEDLVTYAKQRKIVATQEEMLRQVIREEMQNAQAASRSRDIAKHAALSEKAAREKYSDFDKTIKAASKARLLTKEDMETSLLSDNPAESLYARAKESLDVLGDYFGVTSSSPPAKEPEKENTESEEEIDDPEKVFEELFGG